ncbi:MAG TPA: type II secretion system protein [Candidatus Dormibacteraeota bacterium]
MKANLLSKRLADARHRARRGQAGFTLVELLVVIAILGILAAIVLFNISGVNASAACNAMRTDGATVQGAADLYYNNRLLYPVLPADVAAPANGAAVNVTELLTSNLLHQRPAATETFTYITGANYGNGTVHGVLAGAACTYNP